jgi:outer membrane protein assembly factor BamA
MTLRKVQIVGLKRLNSQQVIDLSGLHVGDTMTRDVIDAAAQKLMDTGLFKKLSYKISVLKGEATAIFEVEEATRNLPVVFDNFVWFSDEEIARAIRQDVPFFDGTAPEAGTTTDKIAAALGRLLAAKKISGEVDALPYPNLATGRVELLFSVKGARLPICSVHFTGANDVSEADLIKASQFLLNTNFSRKDVSGFAQNKLFPLYSHIGHVRAEFQNPTAAMEEPTAQCNGGVAVTLPVEEGLVYSWGGAEWSGNQIIQSDELTAALGMKAGEVADGIKIDNGIKAARKTYGRRGYLTARFKASSTFDDSTKRVDYRFEIEEGQRYFMGTLTINGLQPDDTEQLRSKWTLGTNAVYDESYLENFRQTTLRDFVRALTQKLGSAFHPSIEFDTRPNLQKQTVDVIIAFK